MQRFAKFVEGSRLTPAGDVSKVEEILFALGSIA